MANLQTYGDLYVGENKVTNIYLGDTCVYQKSPYPDPWENDGKVWAYYNVTSTSSSTKLLNGNRGTFSSMEIDGGSAISIATTYTFSTTGEHLVKFNLARTDIGIVNSYEQPFRGATALVRVYIPDGITAIGQYAFSGCTGLTLTRLPSSITSFNSSGRCFSNCSNNNIFELNLPSLTGSVPLETFSSGGTINRFTSIGTVTSLGNYAFRSIKFKTPVVLPNTITSIGSDCFRSASFPSLVIPSSITTIGHYGFISVTGLIDTLYLPNLTSLGSQAFNGSGTLTINSITSLGSITSIPANGFYKAQIGSLTLPSTLTTINTDAFNGCNIQSLSLPTSLVTIGNKAFMNNAFTLEELNLPNLNTLGSEVFAGSKETIIRNITSLGNITAINSYAFGQYCKVYNATLPATLTSIAANAFANTSVAINFTINATTPPTLQSSSFKKKPASIKVPAASVDAYKTASVWKNYADVISAI